MAEKKKREAEKVEVPKSEMIAKRAFLIVQNEYARQIQAGDDVSDVPPRFHENLRTEKVI